MSDGASKEGSQSMRVDHIGEALQSVLRNRKEPFTTIVNVIADRYMGLVERAGRTPMQDYHAELYCNVLREVGRPLTAREIATFPVMVEDWLARHPEFPQGPGSTALMIVKASDYASLMALVDSMEGANAKFG